MKAPTLAAVRKWKFTPATKDGVAVDQKALQAVAYMIPELHPDAARLVNPERPSGGCGEGCRELLICAGRRILHGESGVRLTFFDNCRCSRVCGEVRYSLGLHCKIIMKPLALDSQKTALVLIDLQQGIIGRPVVPHSGPTVLQNATRLAARFRALGATVVLVRVAFHRDLKDFLDVPVDEPSVFNPNSLPPNWFELAPELGPLPGDIVITKHQWGAFYGTELDLQLRRRNVRTIVLGGISTNIGVESTARNAYELGYAQVFVEDMMASFSAEMHEFAVKNIFPRIGNVRSTEEVLLAHLVVGNVGPTDDRRRVRPFSANR